MCCSNFFCSLPSELVCIILERMYTMWFLPHLFCSHNSFTLQKICECVDDIFLVLNESHDNHCSDSEKNLQFCTKKDLFADRLDLFLIFLSTTAALNKLNYYQIFRDIEHFMSLLGPSRIRHPPVFRKQSVLETALLIPLLGTERHRSLWCFGNCFHFHIIAYGLQPEFN